MKVSFSIELEINNDYRVPKEIITKVVDELFGDRDTDVWYMFGDGILIPHEALQVTKVTIHDE